MLASVRSAVLVGVQGLPVTVEVHVSNGLPGYTVVGLPDTAVRESRDRVRAALLSSGLQWPQRRVTVNLAPSAVRKSGTVLDLAFGLGVVLAGDLLPSGALDGVGVLGELGLDGSVRPVAGVLALASALKDAGATAVVVPFDNAPEAALVAGLRILPATSLDELRGCLKGERDWPPVSTPPPPPRHLLDWGPEPADLGDVRGLGRARLALAACAAGGHHLLLTGPPGAGKSLLARCLPSILPPLEPDEALEVTRIRSAAALPTAGLATVPPFRAPHHTASAVALVGGGTRLPRAGEVTLAHRGTLFLDELGEFSAVALDALRQPLEERVVRISRQGASVVFPADFVLVAATNPCPCGLGPPRCTCGEAERARYRRRLSGPLLDRFDLRVAVVATTPDEAPGAASDEVRERVLAAVRRQRARYRDRAWRRNAHVPGGALAGEVDVLPDVADALREHASRLGLTGRGFAGARRLARTLADLDDEGTVSLAHAALATALRAEILG